MKKIIITVKVIIVLVALVGVVIGFQLGGLRFAEFFRPKWQDVERKTFERTRSYTHGKTQDLAKYFEEFQKADPDEQVAIKALIRMGFAEFDEKTIHNDTLRLFLIEQRGF